MTNGAFIADSLAHASALAAGHFADSLVSYHIDGHREDPAVTYAEA